MNQVSDQIKKATNEAVEAIQKVTPQVQSATTEEVEKLFSFEYSVVEISGESGTRDIEYRLQQLGKERWECFHIERAGTQIRFYLKRRPQSYLRYVPRWFP